MDVYITVFLFISGPNRTNWTKRGVWLPRPPSEYLVFVAYLSVESTNLFLFIHSFTHFSRNLPHSSLPGIL